MKLVIEEFEFGSNNVLYLQIDRRAMGSLLEPKLTNISLFHWLLGI